MRNEITEEFTKRLKNSNTIFSVVKGKPTGSMSMGAINVNDKTMRIIKSLEELNKATNYCKLKKAERIWIQNNSKINLLNYFYYRYLTNEFEIYILNMEEKT